MDEHRSLQFWLESINLAQYYEIFVQHGLYTRELCESLDNDTLDRIGVNLEGHKRRILNHLPRRDTWTEDSEMLPNLPPKQKSVRESFLYENLSNFTSSFTGSPGSTNNQSEPQTDSPTDDSCNQSNAVAREQSQTSDAKLVSPKPVPRPRQRTSKTSSPATTPSEEKPIPVARPTPTPRRTATLKHQEPRSQPKGSDNKQEINVAHSDSKSDFEVKNERTSDKVSKNDKLSVSHMAVDSTSSVSVSHPSVASSESFKISGVCLGVSTTDDHELYAFPDKKQHLDENNVKHSLNDNAPSGGTYTDTLKNETPYNSDNLYSYAEDIQGNTDKKVNEKPPRASNDSKSHSMTDNFEHEEFVNAKFDPVSKVFIPMTEDCEPSACGASGKDIESGVGDEPYEAIWDCKGDNSNNTAGTNRLSNLMQFTPLVNGPYDSDEQRDTNPFISKRMSTFGKNRDSASFDLPPPQFAPPPLPDDAIVTDVIADFDPLKPAKPSENLPNIPPRPKNYTPPNFQPYANIPYQEYAASATLPGTEGAMEPDLPLYSPQEISGIDNSNMGASDPFTHEDPFGQFEPDEEDFDHQTGSFPPASCQNNTKQDSFVCVGQTDVFNKTEDSVYDFASAEQTNFDPFGLHRQQSSLSSLSTGSNESKVRLSEVPPAPKNFHVMTEPDSTYSLAENINDADSSSIGSLDDIIDRDREQSHDDASSTMTQVEILPASSLSPRRRERSGYLWKQGGVRQNRGWRKRWVIFDGKSLRYYSNSRDQVSKRIVPLSCMTNVEIDVKSNNSKQFKFKLHCTNRVFLFSADNLDECKMWSNTLMEAIITYTPPPGGEVPGEDMADPDMDGWIKINRNRYKFYVALKKHKLCYYQSHDDYKMASPLHEIEMKLSSVKEVDRTKLQLNTHYSTFLLHFESSSDASNWNMCIEDAITDAIGDNVILDQVKENPANAKCADCGASDAHWASMNLGIVLCLKCAGIHRSFDLHLSKVRSLRMDTRVWNTGLIEMFKVIGNDNANNFWLKNLVPGTSINKNTPINERKQHIEHKYRDRKYCDIHAYAANQELLNQTLLQSAQTDDVLLTYQILFTGADVMYHMKGKPDTTAYELAKEAHQRIQMELLLQNGGDKTKNFMPGSEEASLVAKLRSEVHQHGYLYKTGSNLKDFLKRWCVLEHGHISYYVSEGSKVEKGRIDNESILFIQAVHNDKYPYSFEISSKKENRVYLFAANTDSERMRWMQSIARVFCPVDSMDQVRQEHFSLAGYTYMKTGFNSEWQRTWILLENRKLIFKDKEETEREQDSVDLRKVSSIAKITQSLAPCEACLEPQGSRFVMKATDRILYFQADLTKDTDRLFNALEGASQKGGDMLEDQPLTNDDIPVIISTCIDFIQQHGIKTTGLYRKAEQEAKIKGLLQKFHEDARSVVLRVDEESVDLVCNVLKRFLRTLADPLLTKQLYERWLHTASQTDHNVKLQWYKYLLQQLPRINYLTLKTLAVHLSKLSKHSKENLMTLSNISIAFGPTLMNTDNSPAIDTGNIGNAMALEMKVIEEIVLYHDWLFDVKEDRKSSVVEDEINWVKKKIENINDQLQNNDMPADLIISVYILNPKGSAESIKINGETTVEEVVYQITTKHRINAPMTLHEIIKEELDRPLCPSMKVWPVITQWQNWPAEYAAGACLCLKSNEFQLQMEEAYDRSKPLFCEMKFSDAKGRFKKVVLEFAQAKLSCYKDTKNVSNPAFSWNIEDLSIYMGHDSKRSPPTKYTLTVLVKGDKFGERTSQSFGRIMCCNTEQDLLMWLAGLIMAQNSGGFS
ncbi:ADP-ribosylation factor GTPase-activating protein agd4 [Mactra antiquata]